MSTTDPYAHRAKALDAAASPQFTQAGIVHAVVYLGDQLARLNDLAAAVATSQPAAAAPVVDQLALATEVQLTRIADQLTLAVANLDHHEWD